MHTDTFKPLAESLFSDIRALSCDGVGVTRESYGRGETLALEHLRRFALVQGLAVATDRAGNMVFSLPGTDAAGAVAWCGSHIDSVPQGGNFDGLAGIVAGLLCLLARRDAAMAKRDAAVPDGAVASGAVIDARADGHDSAAGDPRDPVHPGVALEVIAFRGEESAWFGRSHIGSGALLGKVGPADLALRQQGSGDTLAECMARAGADLQAIGAGEILFDRQRLKAYLELHIEQGPVMVAADLPVAVVSGIRGNVRHKRIVCHGDAQHSGVVPRHLRVDAMFGVADLLMRLDEHWRLLLDAGRDLVVTSGIVGTDPAEHSITRIPGQVGFSLEARSKNQQTLDDFEALVLRECAAVEAARGVRFEFDRAVQSAPAVLDAGLGDLLARACDEHRVRFERLPSGAGHDASLFANAGVPSAMLFVRNQNGSHNPREAMEMDDFMQGVRVLERALATLQ
jgi:N-carbamoyl-L-amino-acid hydrolase